MTRDGENARTGPDQVDPIVVQASTAHFEASNERLRIHQDLAAAEYDYTAEASACHDLVHVLFGRVLQRRHRVSRWARRCAEEGHPQRRRHRLACEVFLPDAGSGWLTAAPTAAALEMGAGADTSSPLENTTAEASRRALLGWLPDAVEEEELVTRFRRAVPSRDLALSLGGASYERAHRQGVLSARSMLAIILGHVAFGTDADAGRQGAAALALCGLVLLDDLDVRRRRDRSNPVVRRAIADHLGWRNWPREALRRIEGRLDRLSEGTRQLVRAVLEGVVPPGRALRLAGRLRALLDGAEPVNEQHDIAEPQCTPPPPNVWTLDPDLCRITFEGRSIVLRKLKGLEIIAKLLVRPNEDICCLELLGRADDHAGAPVIDAQALKELRIAIEDAKAFGKDEEVARLEEQVRKETDRRGRPRLAGGAVERARKSVGKAVTTALGKIQGQDEGLYLHLLAALRTPAGRYTSYRPPEDTPAWFPA